MRRNATKVAAAVLTLAVTMTSVNIPTTAAAATKKVKLNKTKKTLTVGKTLKLTLKEGNKKVKATKVKFTSSKKAIATVTKYGNVKAKKKGKATITATYKKKKYKCKITVKKKATTNPTTAPTNAPTTAPTNAPEPTTAPTDAPTTAPTDAPSTAPTDAPATVGTIKEFKAVGAKKLQVEFEAAVPEASKASLTFKRGNSVVAGTAVWDAENKVATFTSNSILTQGKYTASMEGVNSKEADVEAEKVADIVINGDKDNILTGTSDTAKKDNRSNDEAYIYYDIVNQYGESIRERTTVNWSITSCDTNRENKSLGLVVARRKNDKEIFIFGTQVSITAVCIKDNVPVTKTKVVTIGEQQAIDEVIFKGFVKKSNKGKKIEEKNIKGEVPADFAKDTWAVLYQAKDQHGNLLEAANDNLGGNSAGAKIAMVSGQPTYIENKFTDGGIYSVTSAEDNRTTEYSSATIEPGAYIDRGESIDLTAISTKTGKKSDQNYAIGKSARLKSFEMEKPAQVVADGDVGVVIPFTALDMDGNPTDNYKTIVRSSNKLNLTASEGTLTLSEGNDGKAILTWTDEDKYTGFNGAINPYKNSGITIDDGVDRAISLTAVVTGEEASSKQTTLSVSDMRRPASIEDVYFGQGDAIIGGNSTTQGDFDYLAPSEVGISHGIAYNDQYGVYFGGAGAWEHKFNQVGNFWNAAKDGVVGNYFYSISVRQVSDDDKIRMVGVAKSSSSGGGSSTSIGDRPGNNFIDETNSGSTVSSTSAGDVIDLGKANGTIKYNINPKAWNKDTNKRDDDVNATIRYSIVERPATSNSSYNEIGKARTESYTVVPIQKLSDFAINTGSDRLGIETDISGDPNGSFNSGTGSYQYLGGQNANNPITGSALNIRTKGVNSSGWMKVNRVDVTAKYKDFTLAVPFNYIRTTDDYTWNTNSADTVSGSSILVNGVKTVNDGTTPGDGYEAFLKQINEGAIRWRDLYNVNSARYERIDTTARLEFIIGADVNNEKPGVTDKVTHSGTRVSKRLTISDDYAQVKNIKLNNGADRPNYTDISISGTGYVSLFDQYGQDYLKTDYKSSYTNYPYATRAVLYTVSGYEENHNGRIEGNLKVSNKSNGEVEINGAELGDSYTLKAEVENSGLNDTIKVTVGSDLAAYIDSSNLKDQSDYKLRTEHLGYNR